MKSRQLNSIMKYIYIYLLISCYTLSSQNRDSLWKAELKDKVDEFIKSKVKDLEKSIVISDSIKNQAAEIERLKTILEAKEEEDLLSRIVLIASKIKVGTDSLEVERVEICITNGMMGRARIIFKNNMVYETQRKDAKQLNKLNAFITTIGLFDKRDFNIPKFHLSDAIVYLDELDKTNYLPKDELITLTPDDKEKKLVIQTDLNSHIDFRVYSDMLALFGKEGNGLVQSEVSSRIPLNTRIYGKNISIFNYAEPLFKLSKFDNQFKSQEITDSVKPFKIDGLKLNQLAYIELGCKINLFKATIFQHTFDILNVGLDFKYSDVYFKKTNSLKTLNTFAFYVESRVQLLKYKNFGMETGLQGYFQKVQDSSIELFNVWDPYLIFDFSLFYHPNANPLNMIFVRFKNVSTGLATDFYSVLQFGYKSRLSFKK